MKIILFIHCILFFFVSKAQTPPTYSGWTVWSGGVSNISIQTRSGSDLWLEVTSSHCTHGTHQYFNTMPGISYAIGFDLDLGTTSKVNLLIWDVTPGGTLYNLRLITHTANANNALQALVAGDTRVLIQFRQDDCGVTRTFYLDNIKVWNTISNPVSIGPMADGYRFAFNGKERTDEVYGEGNFYDYGFRVYDARIGKFLSVDPITAQYPELTPYQFASNTPIMAIDLDGKEALLTIITTNDDGTTTIQIMADYTVEGNAGVPMRNRIVLDGVDMGANYGSTGIEILDKNMKNIRMVEGGYLAYDTPNGETVTTRQGNRTLMGENGSYMQLNDFLVTMKTDDPIGTLKFSIPFDGSTKNGTSSGPVNLSVPANADPGSGSLDVTLTDFIQPNTSTISISGATTKTSTDFPGSANNTAVNTKIAVGAGNNILIETPTDGTGTDDYELKGTLNYTVTPR